MTRKYREEKNLWCAGLAHPPSLYLGSAFGNSAGLTKAHPVIAGSPRPFRIPLRKKRCYNVRFVLYGIWA